MNRTRPLLTLLALLGCAGDDVTAPSAVGTYALTSFNGQPLPIKNCLSISCDERTSDIIELKADGVALHTMVTRRTPLPSGTPTIFTNTFVGLYTTSGSTITVLAVSTNAMIGTIGSDQLDLREGPDIRYVYARQ